MKEQFDSHRARLTRAEDQKVWNAIQVANARKRRGWRWFGIPATAISTLGVVAFMVVMSERGVTPESVPVANDVPRVNELSKAPGTRSTGADVALETPNASPVETDAVGRLAGASVRDAREGDEEVVRRERQGSHATGGKDDDSANAPAVSEAEPPPAAGESGAGGSLDREQAAAPPVDPVQPSASALKGGVVAQGGELHVRGGRVSEGAVDLADAMVRERPRNDPPRVRPANEPTAREQVLEERVMAWGVAKKLAEAGRPETYGDAGSGTGPIVVGGSDPVNDQEIDAMFFEHYGVNPFVETREDALATFAVDVDNASYTLARSYLRRGVLPPKDAVRVEEFINAFSHDYEPPGGFQVASADRPERFARSELADDEGQFAIHLDAAPSRFGDGLTLLRVGLKGREISTADRKPLNLTFVIDASGSMDRENRIGLVKRALTDLLYELHPDDELAIVVYNNAAGVVAGPASLRHRWTLEDAILNIVPSGGTNAGAGLVEGYRIAEQMYDPHENNRVVLCSDGVANIGNTGADSILADIKRQAGRGIYLTAIGVGMGNYNDVLLEKLANQGDGNYFYVDRPDEAERVLKDNFMGTLQVIARDVKIQVEFEEDAVDRYRLLGYENRDVADVDFRNDAVDAGEVGAGHEVTALFELALADRTGRDEKVATVRIRFEDPDTGKITEVARTIRARDVARSFDRAPQSFRRDAVVAEFAEILRRSYWAKDSDLGALAAMADDLAGERGSDPDTIELAELVSRARDLWPSDEPIDWKDRER